MELFYDKWSSGSWISFATETNLTICHKGPFVNYGHKLQLRKVQKKLFPVSNNHPLQHPLQQLAQNPYITLKSASLSDFQLCNTESDELYLFQKICFSYIGVKKALMTSNESDKAISLKSFRHVNCSTAVYTYQNVLDQNADNKETIADVLSLAYEEFKLGTEIQHLVVAGDAKTYSHLQTLRFEHGNKMSWLLPFIGDWHVLKNYQPVLMKIYFEAGLKQLANLAGHHGETKTSLANCTNFKITHRFLL